MVIVGLEVPLIKLYPFVLSYFLKLLDVYPVEAARARDGCFGTKVIRQLKEPDTSYLTSNSLQ